MENRQTLLHSLKETVEYFKNRKSVGRLKTEHAIFIPSALMKDKAKETEDFIKTARHINQTEQWSCPVEANPMTTSGVAGVEFVFQFQAGTKFDEIIEEIQTRL